MKRFSTRTPVVAFALLGLFAGGVPSAIAAEPDAAPVVPAPAAAAELCCELPAAANANPAIDWLDKLEARGREIRTLQADLVHTKVNSITDDQQVRLGGLEYAAAEPAVLPIFNPAEPAAEPAAPQPGKPARFAVRFHQLLVDGRINEQNVDYLFDGSWLAERDAAKKQFIRRQVVAPGETFDPLKIDGPFPVPLGQKRDEVLARFNVELIADAAEPDGDADKPAPAAVPATIHLRLTPRTDVVQPQGKQFETVDLWFDREQLLPVKVVAAERAAVTTVQLSNIQMNAIPADQIDKRFDTTPPREGWRVIIEPWKQ